MKSIKKNRRIGVLLTTTVGIPLGVTLAIAIVLMLLTITVLGAGLAFIIAILISLALPFISKIWLIITLIIAKGALRELPDSSRQIHRMLFTLAVVYSVGMVICAALFGSEFGNGTYEMLMNWLYVDLIFYVVNIIASIALIANHKEQNNEPQNQLSHV